jgi:Trk K+ transport system NAD-binding subunit
MSGVPDPREQAGGDPARQRFVVCGDNSLAIRLVTELATRYGVDVSVIIGATGHQRAGHLAALPGVEVIEADRLTSAAFTAADLAGATALALVAQDDAGNLDAALLAEELNPGLRIVVRMFNESLADGTRVLLRDCAVLSESAIAAPGFVAAAMGDGTPTHLLLAGRRLIVARRGDVPAEDVVHGLALVGDGNGDGNGDGGPELLPGEEGRTDLVLADAPPAAPAPHHHHRHPLRALSLVLARRLRILLAVVVAVLAASTLAIRLAEHLSWWDAVYVTVLTALGAAGPDLAQSGPLQLLQVVLTLFSVALIPVLTAAIVDAVVRARLALAAGGPTQPVRGHLVVVGLGNLGTRVLTALHEAGCDIVAVDHLEQARGVAAARALGIPVVVGDPTQEAVLRAAWVHTCRTLLVLSNDDMRNLQTALLGRALGERVRVVLRLFDADFADRVERAFGLTTSRSVSYLAAPTFAAAMVGRAVLDTIPVRRHVLLVAELPIGAGCALEGRPVTAVDVAHEARLLAVRTGRGDQTLWAPPHGRRLVRTDRILVVATRRGLGRLLAQTGPAPGRAPVRPLDVGELPPTHAVRLPSRPPPPTGDPDPP